MTNEELTVIILDKLGWDYDKELNPNRYRHTLPLYAGELILSILDNETVSKSAKVLAFSYKVVNTAITREFVPIMGNINGGTATWRFRLEHYAEHQKCTDCKNLKPYTEFHLDNHNPRGYCYACKSCRIISNAKQYKTEVTKEAHQRSYKKNYGKIRERQNQYRGERSLRIPPWSQKELIEQFYENCPEGYQVDHIIPLKGKEISGLHVIENLQYLLAEENLKKGNKFVSE